MLLFFPEERATHALAKHRNTRYFRKSAKQTTQNLFARSACLFVPDLPYYFKEISPKPQKNLGQRQ